MKKIPFIIIAIILVIIAFSLFSKKQDSTVAPPDDQVRNNSTTTKDSRLSQLSEIKAVFPVEFPFPSDSKIIEATIDTDHSLSNTNGYILKFTDERTPVILAALYEDSFKKDGYQFTNQNSLGTGMMVSAVGQAGSPTVSIIIQTNENKSEILAILQR